MTTPTPEERADLTALEIVHRLQARGGFDGFWDSCDAGCQREMLDEIAESIRAAFLAPAPALCEAAPAVSRGVPLRELTTDAKAWFIQNVGQCIVAKADGGYVSQSKAMWLLEEFWRQFVTASRSDDSDAAGEAPAAGEGSGEK